MSAREPMIRPTDSTDERTARRGGPPRLTAHLGGYAAAVNAAHDDLLSRSVMRRIGERDHTVWRPEPDGIADRLGWLDIAERMKPELARLDHIRARAHADGMTSALLVGMGGSSLAPEVFRLTFGVAENGLDLTVLDTTQPDAVGAALADLDPSTTLLIVATKSGGTVETLSLFRAAYRWSADVIGMESAGRLCIAITDPGSSLEALANDLGFREVELSDPTIGGRYAALSSFGLLPAALIGMDVRGLVERGEEASRLAADPDGVAAWLGAALGALAKRGRDKLTLVLPDAIAGFGDWVEQLVAESTGKDGIGILPVVGERLGSPEEYGADRLFVRLRLESPSGEPTEGGATQHEGTVDALLSDLADAGHPVITLTLADRLDLGAHFVLWEMATAVASHVLGVQPFDQPNVESAKVRAREMVDAFKTSGALPDDDAVRPDPTVLADALEGLTPEAGDYVSLQAFINPTPEAHAALNALRSVIRDRTRLAVTVGFGPRFLHSTGQLHKGDGGRGTFIQLTSGVEDEVGIPDAATSSKASLDFGTLISAQALGDATALREAGRRVLRLRVGAGERAAVEIAALAREL